MRALAIDRPAVVDWYLRNRARSRAIFDLIDPAAYYSRPIALRNPIVFYEGHLPAFSIISFLRRGLGHPPIDARLEKLFERGIDPDSAEAAVPRSGAGTMWPSRDEVLAFAARADDAIVSALERAEFLEDRPAMQRAQALYTALEHEAMHQETLLYMWLRLPYEQKTKSNVWLPPSAFARSASADRRSLGGGWLGGRTSESGGRTSTVRIPAGTATLGADREGIAFGWDNEFDEHRVEVPGFEIDVFDVTNAEFMEFVDAGGYRTRELWSDENWRWLQEEKLEYPTFWAPATPARVERAHPGRAGERTPVEGWVWRGMFEAVPLPPDWPVYVSQAEATAYARWRNRRLPTEAEYHRAAFGTPTGVERSYPWGDAPPDPAHGNFDFARVEPVPVGSYPAGASAWGVLDLVGNGWEWTSTVFAPFDGFSPMASYPEYSADFFDGQHFVMKGGSPATAKELLRRSFRNWFRPNYPYVYATFRT
ncbi:MAG: SUMF1/EgtB/PvdO family nonheme iron enzyme, partial [Acidobacteriota bacterium]|nr:SUMF1/EgtB/PvdO family nonheme iron enzyme [Acidobacteriota bacterium]